MDKLRGGQTGAPGAGISSDRGVMNERHYGGINANKPYLYEAVISAAQRQE